MRRLTAAAGAAWLVATVVALVGATPAAAQPEPTGQPEEQGGIEVPDPVPGEPVCAIADGRLSQLSGLVATEDGYFTVNDGSGEPGVFVLDQSCQVLEQIFYPSPFLDTEDMELDRDAGVLWVADTGDNFETANQDPRAAVALWRIDLAGDRTPVIHRFSYEDGQPRDAEALLLDADGTPLIITKAVGVAEIFRPTDLVPGNPIEQAVPLERLGELNVPETGSEHDRLPSSIASRAVTGGAVSPDGSAVVLRTYTDALEFDVTDGDVAGAIVDGVPRVTPLPGEPQGEAITYTPDGERFVTVSEVPPDDFEFTPELLAYTPTAPPPPETEAATAPPAAAGGSGGGGFFNDIQDIIRLIGAIGVFGLLLVIAGVVGIVRARRRAAADHGQGESEGAPVTGRARLTGDERPGAGGAAGAAGVAGAAGAGGVYTSSTARGEHPGGEYPDNGYAGAEYGAEYGGAGHDGGYGRPGGEYHGGDYRGGEYGGGEYGGGQYAGGQYAGGEYGGAGYSPDAGYADGGYPDAGYADPGHGAAGYPGTEYGGAGYGPGGYQPGEYGGPAYGGAEQGGPAYGGGTYQGGQEPAGYGGQYGAPRADQPYDQDWQDHQGYQGQPGGHPQGYGEPAGGPAANGAPQPDYYSDDPDYPYEFREPGRW